MGSSDHASSMRLSVPQRLLFQPFSADEIRQLSVVKVVSPLSFNALGHPVPGGLYDPRMGPVNMGAACATCGVGTLKCVGHMGHIELPLPVLNPLYHKSVQTVLKMSCLQCHKVLIPFTAKSLLIGQLHLLHHGCIVEAQEMSSTFANLVLDDNWDIGFEQQISIKDKIEAHCSEVVSKKNLDVAEWKGETDFRNDYIKAAFLRAFKGKHCPYCKAPLKKLSSVNQTLLIPNVKVKVASKFQPDLTPQATSDDLEVSSSDFKYLMPSDIKDHLQKLHESDGALLNALMPVIFQFTAVSSTPTDALFMEAIPIPPIVSRPVNFLKGEMLEHPQNENYKRILDDVLTINSLLLVMKKADDASTLDDSAMQSRMDLVKNLKGNTPGEKLQYALQSLQRSVDCLLDVDAVKSLKTTAVGLKQIIEKKEGIIRMNMMGKRVNFAARTVITPDPNLNIDEIGIPEEFARKLSYPVPVTYYNVNDLRKMVLNGPFAHPGANYVENEDGSKVMLSGTHLDQREAVAKKLMTPTVGKGVKIVHRHLVNGDILLLNRQPTLHKPSIMAHKARILKGERTFRLHYANCKAYNADFDGDEMNAHFPQNEVARSEGYNLVSVSKQYLVPKDGTPLSGLIQDHVVSGVRLSMRGRFFTKEEYRQLVFQGLCSHTGNIKCLPPCMIKPVQLWSGKQIISTIILNIIPSGVHPLNLSSKAKISASVWPATKISRTADKYSRHGGTVLGSQIGSDMSESDVIIRGGELLCGVLDKMHYGATPYSLVHCMHELYGADSAACLLSAFSKLFTAFLQTEGFTLGVEDILVVKREDKKRTKIISEVRKIGESVACAALDIPSSDDLRSDLAQAFSKDPNFRALLDHQYKTSLDKYTNEINKTCLPSGLLKKFPANDLQLMVQSGAKGSTVNTMQISCLLGQIELEGKRPPLMISGRSLPSFPPYDPSPRAGGFVDGRFMTGIKPQEFFFHCMAGREGLIDTAVKTSRSGYLQRCLVKHLEGLTVRYDLTVRDSDGSVVQYLYGEDGMEVTKCQFLTKDQLPFLGDNVQALLHPETTNALKEGTDKKRLKRQKRALRKWRELHADAPKRRPKPFTLYSQQSETTSPIDPQTGRKEIVAKLCKKWRKMLDEDKEEFQKICAPPPDTVVAKLQPDRHFGSVTEKMDDMVDNYLKKDGLLPGMDAQLFEDVVHFKALAALANPGEPVGLLAAQSIGEPSTQMTLNTFHFAGRGEMNVTLGIPRLREILMVASKNMKTPSMQIPFKPGVPQLDKQANRLRKKLTRVTLADVLECVEVVEKLQLSPRRRQLYRLRFKFLPRSSYKDNTYISPSLILSHFEKVFIKQLLTSISKKGSKSKIIEESEDKEAKGGEGADEENEDDPSSVGRGLSKRRGVAGAGNDYLSSEDESENEDDDATTRRRRDKRNEEHQYSDSSDEDDVQNDENDASEKEEENEKPSKVDAREESSRIHSVQCRDHVESYSFDREREQWCEVTLAYPTSRDRIDFSVKLKDLASKSVITQVRGIRKAFLLTEPSGEKAIKTDGKNLMEMYSHLELLDINRLYTNDIHAVAETFGIEAASKVIVKEIQDVFKVYGITVDPRHLTLVADYMTFDGTFRPLNRIGMEGGASPLQQMSFEASTGFLKNSVLRSKKDDLLSPSARLMLGIPVACGTSSFSLLYSTNQFQIH